jgi:ubiquinone/menaquinone biosynthesis C-methylase UbiE
MNNRPPQQYKTRQNGLTRPARPPWLALTSIDWIDETAQVFGVPVGGDVMQSFVESVVQGALVDLSTVAGQGLQGILIPRADLGVSKIGITEQFLADAQTYHDRYTSIPYWSWLIGEATKGRLHEPPSIILDIGSGSGNSVLPCLEMFPAARIVATDLSESLLAILRDHIGTNPASRQRTALVCLDATRAEFVENSVDLVVGAAILHHLIDPAPCIRRACQALRPGGIAVFFEPFEAGNAVLRTAYERILAEDAIRESDRLPERTGQTLRALINDFRVRAGTDKSADIFQHIDDKWLFTRGYFESIARAIGFVSVEVDPLWAGADVFVMQTGTYLKLAQGLTQEAAAAALPGWAWDVLRSTDAAFSLELKQDLPIEARVTFRREPRP